MTHREEDSIQHSPIGEDKADKAPCCNKEEVQLTRTTWWLPKERQQQSAVSCLNRKTKTISSDCCCRSSCGPFPTEPEPWLNTLLFKASRRGRMETFQTGNFSQPWREYWYFKNSGVRISLLKWWKIMFNHGSVVMMFRLFLLPHKDLTVLMMLISKCQWDTKTPPPNPPYKTPCFPFIFLNVIQIYCGVIPLWLFKRHSSVSSAVFSLCLFPHCA